MNLKELYDQVPVAQHSNIIVQGDRVFVRRAEETVEYLLLGNGELERIRDHAPQIDRKALRAKWKAAATQNARMDVIAEALGLA